MSSSPIIRPRKFPIKRSRTSNNKPKDPNCNSPAHKMSIVEDVNNDFEDDASDSTYFSQADLFFSQTSAENSDKIDMPSFQNEFASFCTVSESQGHNNSSSSNEGLMHLQSQKSHGKPPSRLLKNITDHQNSIDFKDEFWLPKYSQSCHDSIVELEKNINKISKEVSKLTPSNSLEEMLNVEAKVDIVMSKNDELNFNVSRTEKKRLANITIRCQEVKNSLRRLIDTQKKLVGLENVDLQPKDNSVQEIKQANDDLPTLKMMLELKLLRSGSLNLHFQPTDDVQIHGSLMEDGSIKGEDLKIYADVEKWCSRFARKHDWSRKEAYSRVYTKNKSLLSICNNSAKTSKGNKFQKADQVTTETLGDSQETDIVEDPSTSQNLLVFSSQEEPAAICKNTVSLNTYLSAQDKCTTEDSEPKQEGEILSDLTDFHSLDLIETSLSDLDLTPKKGTDTIPFNESLQETDVTDWDLVAWEENELLKAWNAELENCEYKTVEDCSLEKLLRDYEDGIL